MNKKRYRAKIELAAIFVAAALLLLNMGSLVGRAITTGTTEPYPNLYGTPSEGFASPTQKTVYLTFDDGPSKNTAGVLDILLEKDAPSTFFVTAQNEGAEYTPVMLRRMVEEGHTIGLHSYSHEVADIYQSPDNYLADLNRLWDYLYQTVGVRPDILRFVGGSATVNASPSTMKEIIAETARRGYRFYDWDVVSGDDGATAKPVEQLVRTVVDGVNRVEKDQIVVLLHDNPAATTTPEAVGIIVDTLREQGYAFAPLTGEVEPVHIKTERFQLD